MNSVLTAIIPVVLSLVITAVAALLFLTLSGAFTRGILGAKLVLSGRTLGGRRKRVHKH